MTHLARKALAVDAVERWEASMDRWQDGPRRLHDLDPYDVTSALVGEIEEALDVAHERGEMDAAESIEPALRRALSAAYRLGALDMRRRAAGLACEDARLDILELDQEQDEPDWTDVARAVLEAGVDDDDGGEG